MNSFSTLSAVLTSLASVNTIYRFEICPPSLEDDICMAKIFASSKPKSVVLCMRDDTIIVINAYDYPTTRYFRRVFRKNSRFSYKIICRAGVIELAQTIYHEDKHFANNATSENDYITVGNIANLFD